MGPNQIQFDMQIDTVYLPFQWFLYLNKPRIVFVVLSSKLLYYDQFCEICAYKCMPVSMYLLLYEIGRVDLSSCDCMKKTPNNLEKMWKFPQNTDSMDNNRITLNYIWTNSCAKHYLSDIQT